MIEQTVWMNAPAEDFNWESEAWYSVEAAENITFEPLYTDQKRYPGEEWFVLPIPVEVRQELENELHTRKDWAVRAAEFYAEKYPHVPIRVVRHSFETAS